jgi:hypothetical protein
VVKRSVPLDALLVVGPVDSSPVAAAQEVVVTA